MPGAAGCCLANPEFADKRPEDRVPLEVADALRDQCDLLRVHEWDRDRALDELLLESRPLFSCRLRFASLQVKQTSNSRLQCTVTEIRVAGEQASDEVRGCWVVLNPAVERDLDGVRDGARAIGAEVRLEVRVCPQRNAVSEQPEGRSGPNVRPGFIDAPEIGLPHKPAKAM